jgi:hypothetical protein
MVALFVVAVVGGFSVGAARRRSFDGIRGLRLPKGIPAALIGAGLLHVVVLVLPESARGSVGRALAVASAVIVSACLVVIARTLPALRRAAIVVGIGWAMNALVIAANGGMPVSLSAAERIGFTPALGEADPLRRHVELDGSTHLRVLADSIPVEVGPDRAVMSPGDFVLLAGIGLAAHDVMGTGRRCRSSTRREVSIR